MSEPITPETPATPEPNPARVAFLSALAAKCAKTRDMLAEIGALTTEADVLGYLAGNNAITAADFAGNLNGLQPVHAVAPILFVAKVIELSKQPIEAAPGRPLPVTPEAGILAMARANR